MQGLQGICCPPAFVMRLVVPVQNPDQHQGTHPEQCHLSHLVVWSGEHSPPGASCLPSIEPGELA